VLWLAPGGLATIPFAVRDRVLRAVARRRGIDLAAPAAEAEAQPPPPAAPEPVAVADGATPLLAVDDLEVSYGPVQILFGVDLAVGEGEAVALLGTNGAGKSTLLRSVSGLVPPGGGRVTLDGADITGRPAHEVAALGLAEVPGGAGIFPSLTVAENLRAAAWLHRRRPDEVAVAREEVDRLFPVLRERATSRAGSLSGGQQQMLALAMACLTRPRLLLIDELSLGLAPVVVGQLLQLVEQLRARGTTVVVVDQSVNVALEVADRAVFLERGVVRFSGPTAELLDRPDLLRSVFLGGAGTDAGPERTAPGGPAGGGAVLEAEGLCVSFDGVAAVQDVSLAVRPGEIVGVIGPNGAGKTTLFDLLSGFLRPEAGRVRLLGRDVTRASPSARARAGLGRSFQDARLFPSLTVTEAVAAACERWVRVKDPLSAAFRLPNAYDSERAVARRVDELLELLELGRYRASFVGELSTGTRRVVDLACLLAHEPSVVLLDEPAAGIAQREVEALAPLIRRVRDETGATLVVVEHDIPLIEAVSSRLVAMDQGGVVTEGPPGEVLADQRVVASYLGTEEGAVRRSGARAQEAHDAATT
jgi:branched-chain amino acid transport system ATP-binding protein